MGPRIGLIAGSGEFPLFVLDEARRRGLFCAVLAVAGEAADELEARAEAYLQSGPGRIAEAVAFFRKHGVRDIILAGKIAPAALFQTDEQDEAARDLILSLADKRPSVLIRRAIDFLSAQGFSVMDPEPFLGPLLCEEGLLTSRAPSSRIKAEIDFGWPLARAIADQDIGQTLVVKEGLVVAVEGLEGTDEAILRGGRLAGPGTVVLKVGRTVQDRRVDLPGVGLSTVRCLIEAGASALCFEAGRVLVFRRAEAVALAESSGLALLARSG